MTELKKFKEAWDHLYHDHISKDKRLAGHGKFISAIFDFYHYVEKLERDFIYTEQQRHDAVFKLKKQTEWQPIDTAPKDGTFILCLHESGHVNILQWSDRAYWVGKLMLKSTGKEEGVYEGWRKGTQASTVVWKPIKWMPLPKGE